jgi:hypothetical protein
LNPDSIIPERLTDEYPPLFWRLPHRKHSEAPIGTAITDAITLKVKQEFAVKERAKREAKPIPSGGAKNHKAA